MAAVLGVISYISLCTLHCHRRILGGVSVLVFDISCKVKIFAFVLSEPFFLMSFAFNGAKCIA